MDDDWVDESPDGQSKRRLPSDSEAEDTGDTSFRFSGKKNKVAALFTDERIWKIMADLKNKKNVPKECDKLKVNKAKLYLSVKDLMSRTKYSQNDTRILMRVVNALK